MAYRGYSPPPRGERWDRERFDNHRSPPVVERDRYEEVDYYSPPPRHREPERGPPRRVEERYYYDEKDRYDIPQRPRRDPARYYDDEGSNYEGAMVPVRHRDEERDIEIDIRRREYDRHSPPRRPAFVRRQSSLDTFDRKPMPRYGDRMREREEVIQIPAAPRRRSPPRYRSPPQFVERDYEEIRVAEPEYYGDEEFRGYREREISRVRTHRDYEVEEEREEIIETSEFPKRGKTKMPMRLVNKQAIIQLGYPFEEEGETIIILKALGKDNIDEVIKVSREINSRPAPAALEAPIEETRTTYVIEHPSAPPPPPTEEKIVERRTEIIRELPSSPGSPNPDAPRSVKEWDVLSRKTSRHDDVSSHHSHRSPSPARTHHTRKSSRSHHHSRARSVSSSSTRRELIIAEDREESGTIRAGVGALVIPSSRDRRSERDIKAEIRALEQERRALRVERESDRYRTEDRERELIVVKERDDEVVEVRKDRKGRLALVR